jgi:hypothetical protein
MTLRSRAMRRAILIGSILAAIVVAPTAGADSPTSFSIPVDQTFFAPGTSAFCGFPVYVTQRGTANVLLFYGSDGTTVVRELDWNPGFEVTFSAPTQGTSFSYGGGAQLHTLYPDGTDLGDPAIETFTGFNRQIGADPAEAGRIVMSGFVAFVDPSGIPGVDTIETLSQTGNFLGNTLARRCAALAAPYHANQEVPGDRSLTPT